MPQLSDIEWCDRTSNPIYTVRISDEKRGHHCVKVSPGCDGCYACVINKRYFHGLPFAAEFDDQVRWVLSENELRSYLRLRQPSKIFIGDMCDIFHKDVPTEFLDQLFAAVMLADWHIFQILTKRHGRMHAYFSDPATETRVRAAADAFVAAGWAPSDKARVREFPKARYAWPLRNLWLGVSAENQQYFDLRWTKLRDTPATIRFISYEPALGPLNLDRALWTYDDELGTGRRMPVNGWHGKPPLNWLICGGESGPTARPMHPDWSRSVRDQCKEAGVAFFFKQHGCFVSCGHPEFGRLPAGQIRHIRADGTVWETPPTDEDADCVTVKRMSKKRAGRVLDGRIWNEFPEVVA